MSKYRLRIKGLYDSKAMRTYRGVAQDLQSGKLKDLSEAPEVYFGAGMELIVG